jgi:hypothetical protein
LSQFFSSLLKLIYIQKLHLNSKQVPVPVQRTIPVISVHTVYSITNILILLVDEVGVRSVFNGN